MSTVTVDWGDGNTEDVPVDPVDGTWSFEDLPHTYPDDGRYVIVVSGVSGGEATEPVEVASSLLTLTVPAAQDVSRGADFQYETELKNTGGVAFDSVMEKYTFTRADGVQLTETQITFGSMDQGDPSYIALGRSGKSLVGDETFPVAADEDATSTTQINIDLPVGTVVNASSVIVTDTVDEDEITRADYTFTVTA